MNNGRFINKNLCHSLQVHHSKCKHTSLVPSFDFMELVTSLLGTLNETGLPNASSSRPNEVMITLLLCNYCPELTDGVLEKKCRVEACDTSAGVQSLHLKLTTYASAENDETEI